MEGPDALFDGAHISQGDQCGASITECTHVDGRITRWVFVYQMASYFSCIAKWWWTDQHPTGIAETTLTSETYASILTLNLSCLLYSAAWVVALCIGVSPARVQHVHLQATY
ncbi:unnamed protein product [Meganyctiphanes norvegica]|uniref:Uncharacterized protein n=1 Tax=Meganyctiphanes norvegica TaxID=48144 RepID=A0AAV2Q7F7_MEGNR